MVGLKLDETCDFVRKDSGMRDLCLARVKDDNFKGKGMLEKPFNLKKNNLNLFIYNVQVKNY